MIGQSPFYQHIDRLAILEPALVLNMIGLSRHQCVCYLCVYYGY